MSRPAKMKINTIVPTDDYVLITKTDLGRFVQMIQRKGLLDEFKKLDVKAIAIDYNPGTAPKPRLTDAQSKCLKEVIECAVVPLYDSSGKLFNGPFDFTRNTLRALVKKGCLEERQVEHEIKRGPLKSTEHAAGYFPTDLARSLISGD